jgi:hypothetical protein
MTKIKRSFPTADFGTAHIDEAKYANGGLAIQLYCTGEDDFSEPLARLSTWHDATPFLPKNCFFVKLYGENELIAEDAAKSGWFKPRNDLGARHGKFARWPVWELLDERGEGFSLEDA